MRPLALLVATAVSCISLAAGASATPPKEETVPGVVGMAEKDAVKALAARSFNIHILLGPSRAGVAGRVIAEKPSTGRFPAGTTVYLNVSDGQKTK